MALNKLSLAALGVGVLLGAARLSVADTITVHDLSQNTSTGVFTYTVQLDNAADLHAGDGFVIYDFPGLISSTLTPVTGTLNGSQFSLTQTLTSNVLNQATSVDANGFVAALSNSIAFDNPGVPNLSFVYNGPPVPFLGADTATLTLTSSVLGGTANSVYGSVDHSGPSSAVPFSFSANPVLVPGATVPLPTSWLGGGVLFGLIGAGRVRRARRLA